MNLNKKYHPLISAFLAAASAMLMQPPRVQFRQGTSPRHRGHDRANRNIPRGYPGAKLARMALEKRIGVRNPPVVG